MTPERAKQLDELCKGYNATWYAFHDELCVTVHKDRCQPLQTALMTLQAGWILEDLNGQIFITATEAPAAPRPSAPTLRGTEDNK